MIISGKRERKEGPMTRSRKIYKVNIQGMIVEEIDERDDNDFDKMKPLDSSEFIIFKNMKQVMPISARP